MSSMINQLQHWEFGAAGILHPTKSTLRRYYELVHKTSKIKGDIAEFGVSRGASIITTGLLSKELNMGKKIFGFDTFSGFPSYHKNDEIEIFDQLLTKNLISKNHYMKIKKNLSYAKIRTQKISAATISNSLDFSSNNIELVQQKISHFGLQNHVILKQGDFTKNLKNKLRGLKFSLVLMDCDLYNSYAQTLPIIWEHLNIGGYIYLDEYYSLKFPGPRIAVHEFLSNVDCKLIKYKNWLDFERWALYKL